MKKPVKEEWQQSRQWERNWKRRNRKQLSVCTVRSPSHTAYLMWIAVLRQRQRQHQWVIMGLNTFCLCGGNGIGPTVYVNEITWQVWYISSKFTHRCKGSKQQLPTNSTKKNNDRKCLQILAIERDSALITLWPEEEIIWYITGTINDFYYMYRDRDDFIWFPIGINKGITYSSFYKSAPASHM